MLMLSLACYIILYSPVKKIFVICYVLDICMIDIVFIAIILSLISLLLTQILFLPLI